MTSPQVSLRKPAHEKGTQGCPTATWAPISFALVPKDEGLLFTEATSTTCVLKPILICHLLDFTAYVSNWQSVVWEPLGVLRPFQRFHNCQHYLHNNTKVFLAFSLLFLPKCHTSCSFWKTLLYTY